MSTTKFRPIEEIEAKLREKLDSRNVRTRQQAGIELSYVDGHYVISRLNEIYGPHGWCVESVQTNLVHQSEDSGKTMVSYTCQLQLSIYPEGFRMYNIGVGAGHGKDRNPGIAHESAIKESATDALKRAAMRLGPSMGLALYDKEQRDVAQRGVVRHGKQAGRPLTDFTPEQLKKYCEAYQDVFETDHAEEVLSVMGFKS